MKTRLALAISLAISASMVSAEPINIKGMHIGMNADDTVKALAKALDLTKSDFYMIEVDNNQSCLFMTSAKSYLDNQEKEICTQTIGNIAFSMALLDQYAIQQFARGFKDISEGKKPPTEPMRQIVPMAVFVDNSMRLLTLDGNIVDNMFSYGNSDFKVFAKGLLDAYDIPELNPIKCSYYDNGRCWEYNNGEGVALSIIDKTNNTPRPPTINMFSVAKVKPLKF